MSPKNQPEKKPLRRQHRRNEELIQRDIAIYKGNMRGLSQRALGEEFGLSQRAIQVAIERGKRHVKDRGIDIEERRIEIDELFRETLGHLAETVRMQAENGQEEFYVDAAGNKSMKRRKGIDPRIAGELSRSLYRWSEFLGLAEVRQENNVSNTTVVLGSPSAGTSFEAKYANGPAIEPGAEQRVVDAAAEPVEVKAEVVTDSPGWGEPPLEAKTA